jgi:hypothetical protein
MINLIKGLEILEFIGDKKGIFQAITKVPAGFYSAYEIGSNIPSLNRWKKGTLQTIQFKAEDSNAWLTVFVKKGNKVLFMDRRIAELLEVGTVNQLFYNTNLMDQAQYRAVNAKTWADKVFVQNDVLELV